MISPVLSTFRFDTVGTDQLKLCARSFKLKSVPGAHLLLQLYSALIIGLLETWRSRRCN